METIPTAEEFFLKMYLPNASDEDRKLWLACNELAKDSIQIMIEFTKLHTEAALKEAHKRGEILRDEKLNLHK